MTDRFWKCFSIALLVFVAAREFQTPRPGFAQSSPSRNLWVEPRTVDIPLERGGNATGKLIIDLDTGDAWGFPVMAPTQPYPGYQVSEGTPRLSPPQYLGKFDFGGMRPGATAPRRRY